MTFQNEFSEAFRHQNSYFIASCRQTNKQSVFLDTSIRKTLHTKEAILFFSVPTF